MSRPSRNPVLVSPVSGVAWEHGGPTNRPQVTRPAPDGLSVICQSRSKMRSGRRFRRGSNENQVGLPTVASRGTYQRCEGCPSTRVKFTRSVATKRPRRRSRMRRAHGRTWQRARRSGVRGPQTRVQIPKPTCAFVYRQCPDLRANLRGCGIWRRQACQFLLRSRSIPQASYYREVRMTDQRDLPP